MGIKTNIDHNQNQVWSNVQTSGYFDGILVRYYYNNGDKRGLYIDIDFPYGLYYFIFHL
jgi:hypothetical protein